MCFGMLVKSAIAQESAKFPARWRRRQEKVYQETRAGVSISSNKCQHATRGNEGLKRIGMQNE